MSAERRAATGNKTQALTKSEKTPHTRNMSAAGPSAPEGVTSPVVPGVPKRGFFDSIIHRELKKTPPPGPKEQSLREHAQLAREEAQKPGTGFIDRAALNLGASGADALAHPLKVARHIDVGEAAREVAKGERIATREGHEANLDRAVRGIGSLLHRWTPDAVERPRLTKEGRMQRLEERINRDVAAAHAMGIEPKYSPEVGEISPDEQRQIDLVTAGLARNVATDLAGEGVGSRIMEHAGWTRGEWGIKLSEQIRPSIRVSRVDGVLRIQTETHQGSVDQIRSDPATGDISVFRDANGNPTNPPVGTVARTDITTFECRQDKNGRIELVVVQKEEDGSIHETSLRPREEIVPRKVGLFRKREVRDEMMMHPRVEQRTVANIQSAIRNESTHVTAVRLSGGHLGRPRTGIFVEHGRSVFPNGQEGKAFNAEVARIASLTVSDQMDLKSTNDDFLLDAAGVGRFKSESARLALEDAGLNVVGINEADQLRAEGQEVKKGTHIYYATRDVINARNSLPTDAARMAFDDAIRERENLSADTKLTFTERPARSTRVEQGRIEADLGTLSAMEFLYSEWEQQILDGDGTPPKRAMADPALRLLQFDTGIGTLQEADKGVRETRAHVKNQLETNPTAKQRELATEYLAEVYGVEKTDAKRWRQLEQVAQAMYPKEALSPMSIRSLVRGESQSLDSFISDASARITETTGFKPGDPEHQALLDATVKREGLSEADSDAITGRASKRLYTQFTDQQRDEAQHYIDTEVPEYERPLWRDVYAQRFPTADKVLAAAAPIATSVAAVRQATS